MTALLYHTQSILLLMRRFVYIMVVTPLIIIDILLTIGYAFRYCDKYGINNINAGGILTATPRESNREISKAKWPVISGSPRTRLGSRREAAGRQLGVNQCGKSRLKSVYSNLSSREYRLL